jgi:hypothetical protein
MYRQTEPTGEVFPRVFTRTDSNGRPIEAPVGYVRMIRPPLVGEVRSWCENQFGPQGHGVETRWKVTTTRAKFMREDDAFAFKMRWC